MAGWPARCLLGVVVLWREPRKDFPTPTSTHAPHPQPSAHPGKEKCLLKSRDRGLKPLVIFPAFLFEQKARGIGQPYEERKEKKKYRAL